MCISESIREGVRKAHRRAGGGLAEEGPVPTLEGREKPAGRVKKDSEMSEVEM